MAGAKIVLLAVSLEIAAIVSCRPPDSNLPLNPQVLFTADSRFLNDVSSVALKGKIELESDRGVESGDFSAFLCGPDSVVFIVEGLFQVNLFRLIITGDNSYLKSRDMKSWRELDTREKLTVEEYRISDILLSSFGAYLLPQFYLESISVKHQYMILTSKTDNSEFEAVPGGDNSSFLLRQRSSDIMASYKKAKKLREGAFPSEVEIFPRNRSWRILVNIEKLRINPEIPAEIWQLSS